MRLSDVFDFLLLAALWGASFLFMRIAAPELGPVPLMLLRCGIGALTLLPILLWMGRADTHNKGQTNWMQSAVVGVINSAIPFSLLAGSALYLSAGMLSIVNGTAPFFGALIGYLWLKDRLTLVQVIGLIIGFAGVMLLVLAGPAQPAADWNGVLAGIGLALLGTAFYGLAANYAKRFLSNANPLANATGSQIGATVILLLPGWLLWPQTPVTVTAWWSTILLGVFCTGLAYILYFRLIANLGPTRAVTVTFAIPAFGMLWGVLFLDEIVNWPMILGALVVVIGCSLTTGVVNPGRLISRKTTRTDPHES